MGNCISPNNKFDKNGDEKIVVEYGIADSLPKENEKKSNTESMFTHLINYKTEDELVTTLESIKDSVDLVDGESYVDNLVRDWTFATIFYDTYVH